MKFDLMYHLGMCYEEIMRLDLAELQWYYQKLRETKEHENELEKLKLEALLLAGSGGAARSLLPNSGGGDA